MPPHEESDSEFIDIEGDDENAADMTFSQNSSGQVSKNNKARSVRTIKVVVHQIVCRLVEGRGVLNL